MSDGDFRSTEQSVTIERDGDAADRARRRDGAVTVLQGRPDGAGGRDRRRRGHAPARARRVPARSRSPTPRSRACCSPCT